MKYFKYSIFVFALIATLLLSSCSTKQEEITYKNKVIVAHANSSSLELTQKFESEISALNSVDISAKGQGYLEDLYFDEGDYVSKGDLLFSLDSKTADLGISNVNSSLQSFYSQKNALTALYEQKYTALSKDLTNLKRLKSQTKALYDEQIKIYRDTELEYTEEINDLALEALEQQLDQLEGNNMDQDAELMEIEIDKLKELNKSSEESIEAKIDLILEEYKLKTLELDSQITQASEGLSEIERSLTASLAELDISIRSLNNSLNELQLQKDFSLVYAPMDGIITEKYYDAGTLINPGQAIFKLESSTDFIVELEIPDSFLSKIDDIYSVQAETISSNQVLELEILEIYPALNKYSQKNLIKLKILNPDENTKIGAFIEINFMFKSQDGLVVPNSAIVSRYGKNFIYRYKNGKVEEIEVEIAERNESLSLLASSSKLEKEQIVVSGNRWLKDGQEVEIIPLKR